MRVLTPLCAGLSRNALTGINRILTCAYRDTVASTALGRNALTGINRILTGTVGMLSSAVSKSRNALTGINRILTVLWQRYIVRTSAPS